LRYRLPRTFLAAALGIAVAAGAAACASSTSAAAPAVNLSKTPARYNLKAAGCPSTIVLQTDWDPEAEHGGQYEMLGPNPAINTSAKEITGELVAHGGIPTGVQLQIRAGGPAIGYQSVTAEMYQDSSITLGYLATDAQVAESKTQPTVAVMAAMEISPQIIQWSPQEHPAWTSIADIGKSNTKVLYYQGTSFINYLTGKGLLKASQVVGSYDGTPTTFVASGGQYATQAYATAEPYIWSHDVSSWDKPMKYELVADTGFNYYQQELVVRKDKLAGLSSCLKRLVPIMQQATVDYMANPGPAENLIVKLAKDYNNGWTYNLGTAQYAVATMKKLGIIGNAPDGALGAFEDSRVQHIISILEPIYTKQRTPFLAGLTASDLVTNQFIDPSITLPGGS
jgi:hypothetical protein